MHIVDFLKEQSTRCVLRTRMKFSGGYISNRRNFHLNDTFMELQHTGEGYIFHIDTDNYCDYLCIRLLWTCSNVYESEWVRSEPTKENTDFVRKHIDFVYMLNLENNNERYKFPEPFARWLRQNANPYRLYKFFCESKSTESQTDPKEPAQNKKITSRVKTEKIEMIKLESVVGKKRTHICSP